MSHRVSSALLPLHALLFAVVVLLSGLTGPAHAQSTAFKLAVAEAAADDPALAAFYKARDYKGLWTTNRDRNRRSALLKALDKAWVHGLPEARYDAVGLRQAFGAAKDPRARGLLDVRASKVFLQYAQDIQSGALTPSRVDSAIVRALPRRDRGEQIAAFSKSNPSRFIKALPPSSGAYTRLLKAKLEMEKTIGAGGWGPQVKASKLKPGQTGPAVIALRDRLIRMGYLKRTVSASYDAALQVAVQKFQRDHGLATDGVAAKITLGELNVEPQQRLQSILVGLERERWMNFNLGKRHIMVNIPDFHARVNENGKEVFATRVVVGKNTSDRRTPEFSDEMDHMVINPTWNVPRSIATKEYLPKFQQDPNAHSYLRLIDASGRVVDRASVDFTQMTARNFPFDIKQPPSNRNALGLVKFMFPNKHNIYLHDTPAKSLFGRESRAYSHGCVRVADPFDFAYELLSKQESNPEGFFKTQLAKGKETWVYLDKVVPVHLVYQTAFAPAKGNVQFRRDVYGRDAKLWSALSKAGVVPRAVQS
ncbi:L,D-transpeptidase family protein [Dinoroseobacter sp. S76]|uniref:L,D-transpeptidase family protein n=1 Tax=Dinoroseobacter sp. S76 TaxID=3415124 RepID=UPI003C7B7F03